MNGPPSTASMGFVVRVPVVASDDSREDDSRVSAALMIRSIRSDVFEIVGGEEE